MKIIEVLTKKRIFTGAPLETGKTSIAGAAAPAIKEMIAAGDFNDKLVLDYGAGKFGRNAKAIRENGVDVYAYDPFNGTDADGWTGVSNKLPNDKFDIAFTCYVLNVVPDHIEDVILKDISSKATTVFHITRNTDIYDTVKRALLRKDKLVGDFFLKYFATKEEAQAYEDGTLSNETILEFCEHGVQTSRGFQRIPFLENKGYQLHQSKPGYKVYV